MQFDSEDFFYLDSVRDNLARTFIGTAGIQDVYWLPLLNVIGKGPFKWFIKVRYVRDDYESPDTMDVVYDREIPFYDGYPEVLWTFDTIYLKHYTDAGNLKWNMEQNGYLSVNAQKDLAGK